MIIRWFYVLVLFKVVISTENFLPCSEISRDLRFPCKCALGPIEQALEGNPAVSIDCNNIVGEFQIPYRAPIVSFSQRHAGHQSLPMQLFGQLGLPLRKIDFSHNSLRRLTERLLLSLQATLVELRLSDNLLGDSLNPIFSSSELHGLRHLQILDLSGNGIKAIEEGILEGCESLQEFYLDRNSFTSVPGSSINGPRNLRILSLQNNRITAMKPWTFKAQPSIEKINLNNNLISTIETGAFEGLSKLQYLHLARNRLSRFNSDAFKGADNLHYLDLSENFITEFPTVAVKLFSELRYFNLSSNLIHVLDNNDLAGLTNLYSLDLSRNNIANIAPGTFLGLKQLRRLDISVNSLRTIEDDAFEGLDNLEYLNLKDNNILLIPASALGRLPKLTSLQLDYNRVSALSGDILRSIAERVTTLVISRNVVRELPSDTFQYFQQLKHLDLTRNLITSLNSDAFTGLENTLLSLSASQNKITNLAGPPLALMKLEKLDLSDNYLTELARNSFTILPELRHLNLSKNTHLSMIPSTIFHKLGELRVIDLSYIGFKILSPDLFSKSLNIEEIYLNENNLTEIPDNALVNLRNLSKVDLSKNNINNIRQGAFVNVMGIKELILRGNQLSSFKGEFFNTGTSLEVLDISDNQLSYLFPSSFRIHPRLKKIYASKNKFNFFPAELIATLQFLEYVDLSHNELKSVEELDFARLPRLRNLILGYNNIDSVSEMSFHNSTQLQVLDLSYNKLDRLGERMFEGLVRLKVLNLEGNQLVDLPETIFDRSRLQMLENINLANNKFENAPLKALQRQYFFLNSVDLSKNQIKDIPAEDSIMVNIKKLDLSSNPLSENAINNILGEPKTVRDLNLANTNIKNVTRLETPFLHKLNLSSNQIENFDERIFERTTLLENLDISNNKLQTLTDYAKIWKLLKNLQSLNISSNPIISIAQSDFENLESLKYFSMHDLNQINRIEKNAFKFLPNLSHLDAYNYEKLGYIDVNGLLQFLTSLEHVNIETKDAAVGSDQLGAILHPRMKELGLRGKRLRSISSGTLSGLKGPNVMIRLQDTSITTLPPALFFPVPRSSHITLDVSNSQLTSISPQLLTTLDDRRGDLKILGLETNPVICDCNARALRRWLPSYMTTVRCKGPAHLAGKLLVEVGDDELTCDVRRVTTPIPQSTPMKSTRLIVKTTEPEIIWSVAPTLKAKSTPKPTTGQSMVNNDDTLIIGIVGGVVAFIAILIIIICIIRLRMTSSPSPMMGPPVMGPGSSCACSVKGAPPMYAMPPTYAPGYSATLPHKIHNVSNVPNGRPSYSTLGRVPYYQNGGAQPYFIAAYPSDEKIYR